MDKRGGDREEEAREREGKNKRRCQGWRRGGKERGGRNDTGRNREGNFDLYLRKKKILHENYPFSFSSLVCRFFFMRFANELISEDFLHFNLRIQSKNLNQANKCPMLD